MENFHGRNSTNVLRVTCAILFLTFSLAYLYCYQANELIFAQHVLSGGRTCYNPIVGTVLITSVLFLLHKVIAASIRIPRLLYAQTYFLPLLLLLILTDISPDLDRHSTFGIWLWLFPLLLIIHGGALWMIHRTTTSQKNRPPIDFFSQAMWVNIIQLVIMFFLVGQVGSGNDTFHYRMAAEKALVKGDYTAALRPGENALQTDTNLTMIRIYALSRKKQLGERLFEYPLVGGSSALLPNGNNVRLSIYPESKIYHYLGVRIKQTMTPLNYLQFLDRRHLAKRPAADYLLCGYLLDCNLDDFVRTLPHYYDIKGPLPKHYREALTLYTHLHSTPTIIYHDSVMDADFQDFQDMEHSERNKTIRQTKLRDTYGNTYWFYYQYGKIGKKIRT